MTGAAAPTIAAGAPAAGGGMGSMLQAFMGHGGQVGGAGMPSTPPSGLVGGMDNFMRGMMQGYTKMPVQQFQSPGLNASTFGQLAGQRLGGGGGGGGDQQPPNAAQLLGLIQYLSKRSPFGG